MGRRGGPVAGALGRENPPTFISRRGSSRSMMTGSKTGRDRAAERRNGRLSPSPTAASDHRPQLHWKKTEPA